MTTTAVKKPRPARRRKAKVKPMTTEKSAWMVELEYISNDKKIHGGCFEGASYLEVKKITERKKFPQVLFVHGRHR